MFAQDSRCSQNVGVLSSLKTWAKAHHTLSQAISQHCFQVQWPTVKWTWMSSPRGTTGTLGAKSSTSSVYSTLLYFALLYSTPLHSTLLSLSLSLSISTYTHLCIIHIYIYTYINIYTYIHICIYVYMCVWCYYKSTYIDSYPFSQQV